MGMEIAGNGNFLLLLGLGTQTKKERNFIPEIFWDIEPHQRDSQKFLKSGIGESQSWRLNGSRLPGKGWI